jgi:hypothetical protein
MKTHERREHVLKRLASADRSFLIAELWPYAGLVSLQSMADHGLITISVRVTAKGLIELGEVEARKRKAKILAKITKHRLARAEAA